MAHLAAAPDERWVDWDAAFGHLSRQQRAVVILHYRHELTLDEAASLMGCRPGSARRHLSRALIRLRKEIEQ
jgi:RNA polymerase sigma factor (sigma-70 family)